MRVVFDTNVWISYLFKKNLLSLTPLLFSGKVTILYSQELIDELTDVLSRPKLAKYIDSSDRDRILDLINNRGVPIIVDTVEPICRDPKDDFLLALAHQGRADYLVSGDQDLLVLGSYEAVRICSPKQFQQLFQRWTDRDLEYALHQVRALTHPERLQIILRIHERGITSMTDLNDISSSHALRQHIRILLLSGCIEYAREGSRLYYQLRIDMIEKVAIAIDRFNKL